jgi:soluble lytic murein transglycosylase-like protein
MAADRYGVPAAFLHSVARAESAYRVDAVSPKGAIGVMQLMPATAAELGANPRDPAENIDAGARHLRDLLERYDGSAHKALSAYNAGAGAVQKYGGVPPYAETVNYVQKVLSTYHLLSATTK